MSITLFTVAFQLLLLYFAVLGFLRLPRAAPPQTSPSITASGLLQLPVEHHFGFFRAAELQILPEITGADTTACEYTGIAFEIQSREMGCRELGRETLGRSQRRGNGRGAMGLGRS